MELRTEGADPGQLQPAEISKSVRSLWKRYAQEPPSDVVTELRGNVVCCTLADAVGSFEQGLASPASEENPDLADRRSMTAYRTDAMSVMTRLTGRRVIALISDRDAKTDVAKETFILEVRPPRR